MCVSPKIQRLTLTITNDSIGLKYIVDFFFKWNDPKQMARNQIDNVCVHASMLCVCTVFIKCMQNVCALCMYAVCCCVCSICAQYLHVLCVCTHHVFERYSILQVYGIPDLYSVYRVQMQNSQDLELECNSKFKLFYIIIQTIDFELKAPTPNIPFISMITSKVLDKGHSQQKLRRLLLTGKDYHHSFCISLCFYHTLQ